MLKKLTMKMKLLIHQYQTISNNMVAKKNYGNTIIYSVACKDAPVAGKSVPLYVGYTTDFNKCKSKHLKVCEYYKNHKSKMYAVIRENGGWDNWHVEIIRSRVCSNMEEAIIVLTNTVAEFNSAGRSITALRIDDDDNKLKENKALKFIALLFGSNPPSYDPRTGQPIYGNRYGDNPPSYEERTGCPVVVARVVE